MPISVKRETSNNHVYEHLRKLGVDETEFRHQLEAAMALPVKTAAVANSRKKRLIAGLKKLTSKKDSKEQDPKDLQALLDLKWAVALAEKITQIDLTLSDPSLQKVADSYRDRTRSLLEFIPKIKQKVSGLDNPVQSVEDDEGLDVESFVEQCNRYELAVNDLIRRYLRLLYDERVSILALQIHNEYAQKSEDKSQITNLMRMLKHVMQMIALNDLFMPKYKIENNKRVWVNPTIHNYRSKIITALNEKGGIGKLIKEVSGRNYSVFDTIQPINPAIESITSITHEAAVEDSAEVATDEVVIHTDAEFEALQAEILSAPAEDPTKNLIDELKRRLENQKASEDTGQLILGKDLPQLPPRSKKLVTPVTEPIEYADSRNEVALATPRSSSSLIDVLYKICRPGAVAADYSIEAGTHNKHIISKNAVEVCRVKSLSSHTENTGSEVLHADFKVGRNKKMAYYDTMKVLFLAMQEKCKTDNMLLSDCTLNLPDLNTVEQAQQLFLALYQTFYNNYSANEYALAKNEDIMANLFEFNLSPIALEKMAEFCSEAHEPKFMKWANENSQDLNAIQLARRLFVMHAERTFLPTPTHQNRYSKGP